LGKLREVAYQNRSNSPTTQAQRWKTAEMAKKLSVRVAKLTCHKRNTRNGDAVAKKHRKSHYGIVWEYME